MDSHVGSGDDDIPAREIRDVNFGKRGELGSEELDGRELHGVLIRCVWCEEE